MRMPEVQCSVLIVLDVAFASVCSHFSIASNSRMKMPCLFFLFCGLLEVCAVLIRAVFLRFRDHSLTHHERLTGKTTESCFTDSIRQEKL